MRRKEFSIIDKENDDPDEDYELEKDEDLLEI
jgi:hypothetical protein